MRNQLPSQMLQRTSKGVGIVGTGLGRRRRHRTRARRVVQRLFRHARRRCRSSRRWDERRRRGTWRRLPAPGQSSTPCGRFRARHDRIRQSCSHGLWCHRAWAWLRHKRCCRRVGWVRSNVTAPPRLLRNLPILLLLLENLVHYGAGVSQTSMRHVHRCTLY